MPYLEVKLSPAIFLKHKGVYVYRTYRHDNIHENEREYWYGLSPECSDYDNNFDVRNTAIALKMPKPKTSNEISAVLKKAIDVALDGNLQSCGEDFAECWKERVSEDIDPTEGVSAIMNSKLKEVLVTILEYCTHAEETAVNDKILEELDITDEEFDRCLGILKQLVE